MSKRPLSLTNKLLLGLLTLQGLQTYLLIEREAQAETLRLDYCITQSMSDTPEQYLHVVSHPAPGSRHLR